MGAFVYMLHCSDGTYYVGSATGDDLARRIAEHQIGVFRIRGDRSNLLGLNALIGSPMLSRSNDN
jgi:predicted GIY-YIG superfamily endonuclease